MMNTFNEMNYAKLFHDDLYFYLEGKLSDLEPSFIVLNVFLDTSIKRILSETYRTVTAGAEVLDNEIIFMKLISPNKNIKYFKKLTQKKTFFDKNELYEQKFSLESIKSHYSFDIFRFINKIKRFKGLVIYLKDNEEPLFFYDGNLLTEKPVIHYSTELREIFIKIQEKCYIIRDMLKNIL